MWENYRANTLLSLGHYITQNVIPTSIISVDLTHNYATWKVKIKIGLGKNKY